MALLVWLGIMVGVSLIVRVRLHFSDVRRIKAEAEAKGWTDVNVSWEPFAPGWFWEGNERHYLVRYLDDDGQRALMFGKVRFLGYIYWKACDWDRPGTTDRTGA